ncbi:unnamed protein product [Ceutorhynchus assimilis]|uniref:Uncharacterized protein n=1 Tax=Ceutorhynchus assimilis TaxID=467358 RepID=A0A9N9QLI9_9CUCU|nr:unnamed protein product [Ceutorhynchus assimilis]
MVELPQALLKTDLLEDIPNIAAQALENSERVPALKDVIGEYLIPLVLRNIGCSDAGVDKTAQTTLVHLIQRDYVTQTQAEIKICPSILALTKMESQHQLDVNTGAIMPKMNFSNYRLQKNALPKEETFVDYATRQFGCVPFLFVQVLQPF